MDLMQRVAGCVSCSREPATPHSGRCSPRARQRGATMVEFAIVSPCALVLVLGIIQFALMYTAKEIVNEGAFMAARAGAEQNAQLATMTSTMVKTLIPLYEGTSPDVGQGLASATADTTCVPGSPCFLEVQMLNPTPAAFDDFGITSPAAAGQIYIPNDNLEYRPHDIRGRTSGLSIQDANALRIKVTYGYQLKVPLMSVVIKAIMCGIAAGLDAFGDGAAPSAASTDCTNYYSQGRVPLVTYATVQMQTPAFKPDD